MKIVYMGTPDFAVGALESIIRAGHEVTCVVTQPDKPKGRGKTMTPSPVKACALSHRIPVLTPERIKTAEAVAELKQYPADIYVVAAFGQILSQEILDIPPFGCVNIHASLLPRYRGAAPIQWSIIDGEKETGVTIMQMDRGLDTGDILLQKKIEITDEDTGASLFDKLARLGAALIVEALPLIEAGRLSPVKQEEAKSSYAGMLTKAAGKIDWKRSAVEIERLIRGLNSWPSAYTEYRGKQLKIWKAKVVEGKEGAPGTVAEVTRDSIVVCTGKDALALLQIQPEGKRRMDTEEYLRGNSFEAGTVFAGTGDET